MFKMCGKLILGRFESIFVYFSTVNFDFSSCWEQEIGFGSQIFWFWSKKRLTRARERTTRDKERVTEQHRQRESILELFVCFKKLILVFDCYFMFAFTIILGAPDVVNRLTGCVKFKLIVCKFKFFTDAPKFMRLFCWGTPTTHLDDACADDVCSTSAFDCTGCSKLLPNIVFAWFMSRLEFESSLLKLCAICAAAICAFADFLLFSSLKQWFFWWRISS